MKFIISSIILLISTTTMAFEALPDSPPIPKDNPQTAEKIELGKQLYFDTRLSADNTVSCNSCHNVMGSGTDNLKTSKGINNQFGGRNAPTVWNSAFLSVQFWDGREPELEGQAKGPITNPIEMGTKTHDIAVDKIKSVPGYVNSFKKVFGSKRSVTIDNIAKAIAAYERTLITPNSAFDKYIKGDKKAMSSDAVKGMTLFQEVGCIACHSGVNFSGPKLPMGTGFFMKFPTYPGSKFDKKYDFLADKGRFEATKKDEDKHMWRVPTLRNIAVTGPYFHNGKVETLDEAVRVMAKTQLNKDLSKRDVKRLVAFLESLTGERPKQTMPLLPY